MGLNNEARYNEHHHLVATPIESKYFIGIYYVVASCDYHTAQSFGNFLVGGFHATNSSLRFNFALIMDNLFIMVIW